MKLFHDRILNIFLKQNVLGNRCLALYFGDETPPKGFDVEYFAGKEELICYLRDIASEKDFLFAIVAR